MPHLEYINTSKERQAGLTKAKTLIDPYIADRISRKKGHVSFLTYCIFTTGNCQSCMAHTKHTAISPTPSSACRDTFASSSQGQCLRAVQSFCKQL